MVRFLKMPQKHGTFIDNVWRKRVGVEPTIHPAKGRIAGFEDREDHRTPCASVCLEQNDNTRVNRRLPRAVELTEIVRCH